MTTDNGSVAAIDCDEEELLESLRRPTTVEWVESASRYVINISKALFPDVLLIWFASAAPSLNAWKTASLIRRKSQGRMFNVQITNSNKIHSMPPPGENAMFGVCQASFTSVGMVEKKLHTQTQLSQNKTVPLLANSRQ